MPELVTGITGRVESGRRIGLSARIEPVRLQENLLIRRPSWWIMDVEAGFGSRPVHSGFKP